MAWKKVPRDLIEFLDVYLQGFPSEKRFMFGCPVYFVNNNMFMGAFQDSLFFRLSREDRTELLARYRDIRPFEPIRGRVMKDYIMVPEPVFSDPAWFSTWVERSYEFVSALPPKKAKRKQ